MPHVVSTSKVLRIANITDANIRGTSALSLRPESSGTRDGSKIWSGDHPVHICWIAPIDMRARAGFKSIVEPRTQSGKVFERTVSSIQVV